ncbi:unnamed protein product, partial [marine sediment metagenome]
HLYGGDKENRLKQELLLGIGGIRALEKLGISPHLYHSNEGHSAFIGIERLRKYIMNNKLTFAEAKEIIRSSTLFTTHTPVPAGHDSFNEDLLRTYIPHYPARLKITWDQFMDLGKAHSNDEGENFNMSYLAANLSQEVNGVSKLHGKVTREIFGNLWNGYLPEELPIGHVTNGVHFFTWTAKEWRDLYMKTFGKEFLEDQNNKKYWEKIYSVPDEEIWRIKQGLRKKFISQLKDRFKENWIKRHEDPKYIVEV